jgi:hypothetical protein
MPDSPSRPEIQEQIYYGVRTRKGKLASGQPYPGPTS